MPDEATLSFGSFELSPSQRLLLNDGAPVTIGSRALDILVLLAERAGEVVSKRDLVTRVWSDVHVDEGSLRFHVAALRRALGDGQGGARYVINIAGRGYCLVAPVTRAGAGAEPARVPPAAAPAPDRPHTLPARLGRMVGRDETVQRITDELAARRFVSLVGPGGIGKTTVATAVGHALASAFGNQVAFVDLGPLAEARLVPSMVASSLGLMVGAEDPLDQVTAVLRDQRLLLILDSCEHVIEPVAVLAETIFRDAPSVHILATSRESLRVEGEHVHRLLPLGCPPDEAVSAADVRDFPAAQLFLERAVATAGGFDLADADAPALADICRRLDGIPLALELAAARVDAFGLRELAARLDDRFVLATRGRRTAMPRHQTLRATLDWSYERLPPEQQRLLDRLAIFNGAFSLEAASAVCAGSEQLDAGVPGGLVELVAKSMVVALGNATYRLLDTTRSYAGEKLAHGGERAAVAERHARYVCAVFERAARAWEERPGADWLERHRPQLDNLRAALRWAFGPATDAASNPAGDPALGVALTIAALPLWSQLSLVDEPLDWVERARAAAAGLPDRDRRREMQLNATLGGLQMYAMSTVRSATSAWDTALTIATELGDTDYQLRALRALWAEAVNCGEFQRALALAQRFETLAAASDSLDDQVVADRLIGTALHFLGEQDAAEAATDRMLGRYVGSVAGSHLVRYQFNQKVAARIIRSRLLWLRGRPHSALRDVEENVTEALALDHTMSLCNVLTQAACPVAFAAGALDVLQRYIDLLRERTEARALDIWYTYATCFDAFLDIERGAVELGLDRLQDAMESLRRAGFGHYRTSFLRMRAGGLLRLGRAAVAEVAVEEALEICARTGERWCLPELHRLRGEIALGRDGPQGLEAAVAAFEQALRLARAQKLLSWELRAATSLTRCLAGDPRHGGARTLLGETYGRFTEGHDRPDLIAAAALLERPAPGG